MKIIKNEIYLDPQTEGAELMKPYLKNIKVFTLYLDIYSAEVDSSSQSKQHEDDEIYFHPLVNFICIYKCTNKATRFKREKITFHFASDNPRGVLEACNHHLFLFLLLLPSAVRWDKFLFYDQQGIVHATLRNQAQPRTCRPNNPAPSS